MGFNHVDLSDVEPFRGVFFKMRQALGVQGFGVNYLELPPGARGVEHDETDYGHEEVYVILEGSGRMEIGDDTVELRPGRWLRVDAEDVRVPVAGDDGLKM